MGTGGGPGAGSIRELFPIAQVGGSPGQHQGIRARVCVDVVVTAGDSRGGLCAGDRSPTPHPPVL